jgi:hypothetical protein
MLLVSMKTISHLIMAEDITSETSCSTTLSVDQTIQRLKGRLIIN